MRCPNCKYDNSKVVDSRHADDLTAIRRRRECESCGFRFTTFERVELSPLIVVKKDGARQTFNRDKILNGLVRSCEKRPVAFQKLEDITNQVEKDLRAEGVTEVSSNDIGEKVMEHLMDVDQVSYVRFASVYREFKDVNTFMDELKKFLQ